MSATASPLRRQRQIPGRKSATGPELRLTPAERAALSVVRKGDLRSRRALSGVAALARRYGDEVYTELLWALAHLRFDARVAKRHWDRIEALRRKLVDRLEAPIDVRVALVDYFLDVSRKLHSPTIIELKLLEKTQASAYRDELTGLYNYRYFKEHVGREIGRVERYDSTLSLAMFDADDFKRYNDEHGHEAGNRALAAIAKVLRDAIRTVDVAARYGGEEFALILPSTPKNSAFKVAERIRERVERQLARSGRGLTISGGVAAYPADGLAAEALVQAADQAMYVAKSRGKNQVASHGDDRRSHARIPAIVDGVYRALTPEFHSFRSQDVSEGGMLFLTDERLALSAIVDLKFALPNSKDPIGCLGRVVRVEERDGQFVTGISIVEIRDPDRRRLLGFVRSQGAGGASLASQVRASG